MSKPSNNDSFAVIREAGTSAPNYGMDTDDIIDRLQKWQSLCSFKVNGARWDKVDIEFSTLPQDMDAFARELYDFCPDLVDQGTGCMAEMVQAMDEITPETKELIEGVDFEDANYGLEILKREVVRQRAVNLWWD